MTNLQRAFLDLIKTVAHLDGCLQAIELSILNEDWEVLEWQIERLCYYHPNSGKILESAYFEDINKNGKVPQSSPR